MQVNISDNFANFYQYYAAGHLKELNTMYINIKEDRDKICQKTITLGNDNNNIDPRFVATNTCSLLPRLLLQ